MTRIPGADPTICIIYHSIDSAGSHGVCGTPDMPANPNGPAIDSAEGEEGGISGSVLYTAQLASISQDPWFSRVPSFGEADFVALDLDPSPQMRTLFDHLWPPAERPLAALAAARAG